MMAGVCDRIQEAVYQAELEQCRQEVEAMEGLTEAERIRRLEECEQRALDAGEKEYRRCRGAQFGGGAARRDEMMLDCLQSGLDWGTCANIVYSDLGTALGIAELEIPERSLAVRRELFADPGKAKAVSSSLVKGLDEAGVELQADETWACLLVVIKRPTYISQLLPAGSEAADKAGVPRMNLVVEPGILGQVFEAMERDKLR
jgi:hypothetical protein